MFTGGPRMAAQTPFTIEQLCKFMNEGKLMAGKCKKCGKIHFPPRPLCDECFSKEFDWTPIATEGRLLTYTIIHIAPAQFQAMAPYAIGIIGLNNGLKIPGMIKNAAFGQIKIGMPLSITLEPCSSSPQWPQWPRYYFKPA
jgi:uncharacterized OB-fold protein